MNKKTNCTALVLTVSALASTAIAADVNIGDYSFDLDQFGSAAVTYRADGSVTFDGKLWDNEVGVDGFTIGELAAGQAGGDPGDQLSLNDRLGTVDWFELAFSAGLTVGDGINNTFVFYEITSSTAGVDVEGTSWEISINGADFVHASAGDASFLDFSALSVENVNQIAFDLSAFGLTAGDTLNTVRVRNYNSGSETSDADFIFGGLGSALTVVPLPPAAFAGLGMLAGFLGVRKLRQR